MTVKQGMAQVDKDVALSDQLAQTADSWIDLTRPTTEGEYLMNSLAKRYEDLLLPFVSLAGESGTSQTLLTTLLVKQLARAQADIFALKSVVLGKDGLALTNDWDFCDPLAAYSRSLGDSAAALLGSNFDRFRLPIDDSVVGFGWHGVEKSEVTSWRWSGPSLTSSLVLPKLFQAKVVLLISINVVSRVVLPEDNFILINGEPVEYTLTFKEGSDTELTVSLDLDLTAPSPFFLIAFNVVRTIRPSELTDSLDERDLGICVSKIEFMTSTSDIEKAAVRGEMDEGDEESSDAEVTPLAEVDEKA